MKKPSVIGIRKAFVIHQIIQSYAQYVKLKLHKKQRMRDDISYVKQSHGDRRATTLFWPYEQRMAVFRREANFGHSSYNAVGLTVEMTCGQILTSVLVLSMLCTLLAIPVYTTHVNHETRDHKKLLAVPIGRRV